MVDIFVEKNNFSIFDELNSIFIGLLSTYCVNFQKLFYYAKNRGVFEELSEYIIYEIMFDLEKIEFRGESVNYLAEYNEVDIALDTYPYVGGGTTCEALYMGTPVITLVGDRPGARFGYSILKNLGLDDCIAASKAEYIEKAVALATNIARVYYFLKKC